MEFEMAATEHNQQTDDTERRRALAFDANFEIQCLSEAVKKLVDGDEDHRLLFGLMSRISHCSEIVYNAMRLDGLADDDAGRPDLTSLERQYRGCLA